MTRSRPPDLVIAQWLGAIGGGLGIIAGIAQATIGSSIPDWFGNKDQPIALGLLTVALSASVVAAARTLRVPTERRDRLLVPVTVWLLVVAAVCATTVGRLWVIPGLLLIGAAGVTFAASGWHRFRSDVASNWLRGLLGILGALELLMAVSAAPAPTMAAGILAGVALIAAAVLARPGRRLVVIGLVAVTLPFAIATWWAIIPPMVTVVAFVIGMGATHGAPPHVHAADVTPRALRPVG